jgi:hypothetical protein
MIWNIWLGQIEFIPVIGLIITGLVVNKKIDIAWLGLSWLTLITKPHIGIGILVFQLIWLINNKISIKELIKPSAVSITILIITIISWPNWISDWINTFRTFRPNEEWWDASIWPYGLLIWPIALYFSRSESNKRKTRLLSAASLLGSPYFALYHSTTLLTITDSFVPFITSWLIIIIGKGVPHVWSKWSWIIPFCILIIDILDVVRKEKK